MAGARRSKAITFAGYAAMLGATVGAFLVIRRLGASLVAPPPLDPPRFGGAATQGSAEVLLHVLLALLVIIVVARLLGAGFRHLKQPAVIGEVIAGLLLGPSLLGRVSPELSGYLLPPSVAPMLGILSQVGVILYMFMVGLELDTTLLRKRAQTSVAISHASIITPFLLGAGLALWLYPRLSSRDVPFTAFALFIGISMSVTAFPVLARILTDRGMHKSPLGTIALACAAVDDVSAWCLLAFVVGVAQSEPARVLPTLALTAAFISFVFVALRPASAWFARRTEAEPREMMAVVFVALLLAALVTEFIGIHAIFGAFLLGVVVPHDSELARAVKQRLEDVVLVLLLPAFFAFTGMRTQLGLVDGASEWLTCGLIIQVASLGKFGGTTLAARVTGLDWRESTSLGILMNTRGLMELIVLNVGLDLGVLSPTLFAMLVIMAVLTTLATTPLLHLLEPRLPEALAAAERA
jgi:Kef-type K+ transport system membrane component KefB